MSNIDLYIKRLREEINSKNITDEVSILKYIYISLGKRFSFDSNFIPFGNSKYKQNLYKYHSSRMDDLNNCLDTNIIICKSIAKIFEYISNEFNIDVKTIVDESSIFMYGLDSVKYPHVYNIVKLKDGRSFVMDLQDDIHNIQANFFTSCFATTSLHSEEFAINKKDQREIDLSIGYISEKMPYTDEYLYLLHYYADAIKDPLDKLTFILENIDQSDRLNMGYIDRQWLHKTILEDFFNIRDFDYYTDSGRIKFINTYITESGVRIPISLVQYHDKDNLKVFIYNEIEFKYEEISLEDVAKLCIEGLIIHKAKIHGLDRVLKKVKEEKYNN